MSLGCGDRIQLSEFFSLSFSAPCVLSICRISIGISISPFSSPHFEPLFGFCRCNFGPLLVRIISSRPISSGKDFRVLPKPSAWFYSRLGSASRFSEARILTSAVGGPKRAVGVQTIKDPTQRPIIIPTKFTQQGGTLCQKLGF